MKRWMCVLLLFCVLTACQKEPAKPTETKAATTSKVPEVPDILMEVVCRDDVIQPYEHFYYGKYWEDFGGGEKEWIYADSDSLESELPDVWEKLPTVYLTHGRQGELQVRYGNDVSSKELSVYGEDFEALPYEGGVGGLCDLEPGTYYVSVQVSRQGKYVPEAKDYGYSGYECAFRLIVEERDE